MSARIILWEYTCRYHDRDTSWLRFETYVVYIICDCCRDLVMRMSLVTCLWTCCWSISSEDRGYEIAGCYGNSVMYMWCFNGLLSPFWFFFWIFWCCEKQPVELLYVVGRHRLLGLPNVKVGWLMTVFWQ